MIPKTWPRHYCGEVHNPATACPRPSWKPGGVPGWQLPDCDCAGIVHADDCPRRAAIVSVEKLRRSKGHNQR